MIPKGSRRSRTGRSLLLVLVATSLVGCSSGGNGGSGGSGGSNASGGSSTGGSHTGGNAAGGSTGGTSVGGAQSGGSPSTGGAGGKGPGGSTATGGAGQTGGAAGGQGGTGGTPITCSSPAPTGTSFTVDKSGVTFTVGAGKMKVQVCKDDIIRVMSTSAATLPTKTSLSVSNTWDNPPTFCVTEAAGVLTITTARMKVKVNESTGIVSYTDAADKALTAETAKSATAATVQGTSTFKIQTAFSSPADEALYGLGQRQDGNMNMKGKSCRLYNDNMWINIPLLVSNRGYGIFWDAYSTSNFASTASSYTYTSDAGDLVDYYFFYGPSADQIVAGYRTATGTAPMFPKWAYGLFQSKDHYSSTSELTSVINGYRNNKIPVDCVVQDWNYWDPNTWGSHLMDKTRYPDPAALLTTYHTNHVHGMISVWPVYLEKANAPDPTDQDNFKAINAIGGFFPTVTSGYHFYDTFNADARTLVYKQTYDRLIGKYGWDGIWADNTEPQDYPGGSINRGTAITKIGPLSIYVNAYPLQHAKALWEGWRKVGPTDKRLYVLTRSAFAGSQRYGASTWSGDIQADWPTYVKQIPAGLNYAAAGMPYWTTDIGGYFNTSSFTEELFTRWFQFGAFNSIFRIHGQAPKELYGNQWSATGKANLLAVDNLHYRLMPYLYSLAWKVTNESYTIMRPLFFDYPTDTNVLDIKDQFMYGPAILVNPVISQGATSRQVYLPAGTWYDFWTGATAAGGAKVAADAPLSKIPLYVRGGSIVPMGPMIQYATESIDPLEIRVYKGANATFTLYEDEGDTYNYETGKHSTITFTWDDAAGKLSIGDRIGTYTGMLTARTFNVVWVGADHGAGIGVTATADQVVKYDGTATSVSAK